MVFDAQVQAGDMQVIPHDDHVELAITLAFSIPVGPNQMASMPFGIMRLAMARDTAIENATALLKAGESLPEKKKSDIIVPSNLGDVERAAQQDQKLRGKS